MTATASPARTIDPNRLEGEDEATLRYFAAHPVRGAPYRAELERRRRAREERPLGVVAPVGWPWFEARP